MAGDRRSDTTFEDKGRASTGAGSSVVLRAFLIVFGLGPLIVFAVNLRKGIMSLDWPTTSGTVLSSSIDEDEDGYYGGRVTYSYEVAGTRYQGYDVHVSEMHWGNGKEHAEATVNKYGASTAVVVHYDPAFPGTAVLEPGLNAGDSALLLIAALVLTLAAFSSRQTTQDTV